MSESDHITLKERIEGIDETVGKIFQILEGHEGRLGISHKVEIMWRMHVWILCTISAAAGSALTIAIKHWV